MSFTLDNGWDAEFGYFTYRGRRAVGQRLHSASSKAQAYELPTGFFRRQWHRHGFLRSWKRGLGLRQDHFDNKKLMKWINRNPTFYSGGSKPIDRFKFQHHRRPNYFDQPTAPAPDQVNEDHGPRQIIIEVSAETARLLAELATRCTEADQADNGFTSHGPLTIDSLVAMLVEDAALMVSRPGSWEGANMASVFASHGYDV